VESGAGEVVKGSFQVLIGKLLVVEASRRWQ